MAKKILHLDNEEPILNVVNDILISEGYNVISCDDAMKFLDIWEKENPDLILLDIMMPNMSGWDIYGKIRQRDKDVKVAFLSILDISVTRRASLLAAGVSDYIIKPFTREQLIKRVHDIVGDSG